MKTEDRVYCIDTRNQVTLTDGCIYTIKYIQNNYVKVLDDMFYITDWIYASRFISLKEAQDRGYLK